MSTNLITYILFRLSFNAYVIVFCLSFTMATGVFIMMSGTSILFGTIIFFTGPFIPMLFILFWCTDMHSRWADKYSDGYSWRLYLD